MHKEITKIMTLIPSVENRDDPNLFRVGLLLQDLKVDCSISQKARDLAKDAVECIDLIMNECSKFDREIKRLSLITEEMSFTYEKNIWLKSTEKSEEFHSLVDKQCDICNANPFFAMEFLRELDKNVDQIRGILFKMKLDLENCENVRLCYKYFHTLNGIAGYLDLRKLQRLILLVEKHLLSDIKIDQPASENCLDFLFKVFVCLKEYFKNWEERGDSVIIIPDSLFILLKEYRMSEEIVCVIE